MSTPTPAPAPAVPQPAAVVRRRLVGSTLLAHGEPSIWLTGGALGLALFMIVGLLALILVVGLSTFWPTPVVQVKTTDGKTLLGEVTRGEYSKPGPGMLDALPPDARATALAELEQQNGKAHWRLLRTGNYDLTGVYHTWVCDLEVADESLPTWALVVERYSWGNFYGMPTAFFIDGKRVADTPDETWQRYQQYHREVIARLAQKLTLERRDLGAVNRLENDARLAVSDAEIRRGKDSPAFAEAARHYAGVKQRVVGERNRIEAEILVLNHENDRFAMELVTADGQVKKLALADIDRAYPANQLDAGAKWSVYFSRWGEFLSENPRQSNTEGGVFPAIWGTVAMTLLMSLAVVPFGVLAALYLREYARSGPLISAVRIAINNLAGVPSIVFGVFGYGFFCLLVGGFIDGGPHQIQVVPMPAWQWWIGLAAAVLIGLVAFVAYLGSNQRQRSARVTRALGQGSLLLWLGCLAVAVFLIVRSPFFDGLFRANLPNPTFGRGGILWAALTLSLLTLPVVIVATEEALAAVPNSLREGSYACGASKWQTIRRIVLPRAMPGIMTGMILAMARGAGEVAPLMLVGAVKLAPDLPVDGVFPYVHLERSFMHLGYHIFDVGFQSPDSEAGRPMVFTTTLLLITLVALLNLMAIWLRRRLSKRFVSGHF